MSGHSKWAKIHRQKGVADAKRGTIFTRLGNAVTIAARDGGDPDANFKLRIAIDQARESNMPKDNIERAIKRGTGELAGEKIEEITYEGFGPAQSAFIIECVTNSRNRASANIKHLFTKHGGHMSGPNSVMWQFDKKGSLGVKKISEELELELIDAGATDIEKGDDINIVYCEPHNLHKIKKFLEEKNIEVKFAENDLVAKEKKSVSEKDKEKIQKFMESLDDDQDVKDFFTNADI